MRIKKRKNIGNTYKGRTPSKFRTYGPNKRRRREYFIKEGLWLTADEIANRYMMYGNIVHEWLEQGVPFVQRENRTLNIEYKRSIQRKYNGWTSGLPLLRSNTNGHG